MSDQPNTPKQHDLPPNLNEKELAEFNRLFWHSRRGMLELDVLLVPFLKEAYLDLPADDQARFRDLLTVEDPDLFQWFLRNGQPENPDHARIVKIILDRVQPDWANALALFNSRVDSGIRRLCRVLLTASFSYSHLHHFA